MNRDHQCASAKTASSTTHRTIVTRAAASAIWPRTRTSDGHTVPGIMDKVSSCAGAAVSSAPGHCGGAVRHLPFPQHPAVRDHRQCAGHSDLQPAGHAGAVSRIMMVTGTEVSPLWRRSTNKGWAHGVPTPPTCPAAPASGCGSLNTSTEVRLV